MQRKRYRDFCELPAPHQHTGLLDNVALKIFTQSNRGAYHQSSRLPKSRYGVDIDHEDMGLEIPEVPELQRYGPNEQYILGKILRSPVRFVLIVGGIGVGKTRFLHFFMKSVLPVLQLPSDTPKGPLVIHIDFLDYDRIRPDEEDAIIEERISNILCDRIEATLSNRFFDIDDEVLTVWEWLCTTRTVSGPHNESIDRIIGRIRTTGATTETLQKGGSNYEKALQNRREIREEIHKDSDLRRFYLAALLNYVNQHYYHDCPGGVLLLIDNIDREVQKVQELVKIVLKPFVRLSNIRAVITVRQTTYHQRFSDRLSDPIDKAPYCGPTAIEVVRGRLESFNSNPDIYCADLSEQAKTTTKGFVRAFVSKYLSYRLFSSMFTDLCGRSIRKALILAQRILDNSVYDPLAFNDDEGLPSISDVLRAIIVGREQCYMWTSDGLIDNVFQVSERPEEGILVKLRILSLVHHSSEGARLDYVKGSLVDFGYEYDLIRVALNEMLNPHKRLLWSDTVQEFDSPELFVHGYGGSHLFTSSAGHRYYTNLCLNQQYIQEVMLDCYVGSTRIGPGWRWDQLEDRMLLTYEFVRSLFDQDIAEIRRFRSTRSVSDYIRLFGNNSLISGAIARNAMATLARIRGSMENDPKSPEKIKTAIKKAESKYQSLCDIVEYEEHQLLRQESSGDGVPVVVRERESL